MYDKQYGDNVKFWNMQNDYNSPERQMERLKLAGINPVEAYGGMSGSSSASPISTPDTQTPQFKTPEWGGTLSFMNQLYDLEIKQAQVDNLKADNTVKQNTAHLIDAQTQDSQFNLGYKSDLRHINADFRKAEYQKLLTDTRFQLDENERRTLMNEKNVATAAEKILLMRAQGKQTEQARQQSIQHVKNLVKDGVLKQLTINQKRKGIEPGDPFAMRLLGRTIDKLERLGDHNKKSSIIDDVLNAIMNGGF